MILRTSILSVVTLVSFACSPASGDSGNGTDGLQPGASGGVPGTSAGGQVSTGAGGQGVAGAFLEPPPGAGSGTGRPDDRCDEIITRGEKAPLDMHIIFDKSASMMCPVPAPGTNRWEGAKVAVSTFVNAPQSAGISVGMQYFGNAGLTSSCNAADYRTPAVPIAPLPGNAQAIVDSLNRTAADTNTPTAAGLQGAMDHALVWKQDHPGSTTIVVLVTDGQPNACGSVADVANVATAGFQRGVPTYVIGIISPGTPACWADPAPPNQPDLDTIARAGGSDAALMVDASQDAAVQLAQRLDQIRGTAQLPCQFKVPPPPPGSVFDPGRVNVKFTDAAGAPTTVLYSGDLTGCDAAIGGWYFDNASNPSFIHLCPTTCQTVTVQIGLTVDIGLGCLREDIPR